MQRLLTGLLSPCLTAATQGWPWAGPTGSLARCPGQTDMQVGTHRAALLRQAAALPEGASCEGVGALSGNRAGTVILTWDLHCSEGGRAVGLRGLGKRRARDPAKEACVQALLQVFHGRTGGGRSVPGECTSGGGGRRSGEERHLGGGRQQRLRCGSWMWGIAGQWDLQGRLAQALGVL